MVVETLRLGPYQTNCHILHNAHEAWIFDPGLNGTDIIERLERLGLVPQGILLTHSHWDHTLGIPLLYETYGELPLMVHASEAMFLGPEGGLLLRRLAMTIDPSQASIPKETWEAMPQPTRLLSDHDEIPEAGLSVIHTPGHSPGSISFYHKEEGLLFSGDTLFAGTIGRTDLPNSQPESMVEGIKNRLLTLPDETIVYPGHGPTTTISREKHNPWLM